MIFPSVIIVKAMIIFYLQLNVDPNSKNVQCLHTCLSYINNGILQTLTFAHNTQCDIPKMITWVNKFKTSLSPANKNGNYPDFLYTLGWYCCSFLIFNTYTDNNLFSAKKSNIYPIAIWLLNITWWLFRDMNNLSIQKKCMWLNSTKANFSANCQWYNYILKKIKFIDIFMIIVFPVS